MRLKSTLILVSIGLISSLAISTPSFGEEGKSDGKNQNFRQGENFTSIGIRSHGVPTRDWTPNSSQPSTMSLNGPSVNQDQNGSDDSWNSLAFTKNPGTARTTFKQGATARNPISCHTLACTTLGNQNIVFIPVWVGNWDPANLSKWDSNFKKLIDGYSYGISSPHVFDTNLKYFTLQKPALNMPTFKWNPNNNLTTLIPSSNSVSDKDVATYINTFISKNSGQVLSGTPVYVYIGSSNTRLSSGFGTSYCGWHTYGKTATNTQQPYIAIQDFNPKQYIGCTYQQSSPNGNVALDAMASVLAHEIDETITDPLLNAWYDANGSENADKCAWTFGVTQKASNGSAFNFTSNGTNYLIQQNWLADNLITSTGLSTGTACSVTG